jgi:membrane protease YdiL (CAAX protease family)
MSFITTETAEDLTVRPGSAGVARHPLLCFAILTLLISWLPAIPFALGAFPSPLLPFGPFLAAIITAAVVGGRKGLRAYFRRLIQWRIGVGWYILVLLAPVAGWAIVGYVNVLLGAAPPEFAQLAGWSSIVTTTLFFLVYPLTGNWEEPGWRGYALPLLLRRHSALLGSVVLGLLWVLWHVPLFIAGHVPWADGVFLFALTFVFTFIYLHTAGSVPVAFLFHATVNSAAGFFVVLFEGEDRVRMYWIAAVLCAVIAIVTMVVSPNKWRRAAAIRGSGAAPVEASYENDSQTPSDDRIPSRPRRARRA